MELAPLDRALPKAGAKAIPFQVPAYVLIQLYLLVILMILSISWVVLVSREAPPDPFAAYAGLLSGRLDATMVCRDVTYGGEESSPSAARQSCSIFPEDGPFSQVSVVSGQGAYSVHFTTRDYALTVGDLVLMWGRPEIGVPYRDWITLHWPSTDAHVTVQTEGGQLLYFLPVHQLTFAALP